MKGTVFALGGGGFSMSEDGTSAIDDYILAASGVQQPTVWFIPTAGGDSESYIERFEAAFRGRATTEVCSLFGRSPWEYPDLEQLATADVIYVGGGSTANLLALWRLHGLPAILRQAAENGTILAGISAGANCWFQASSTDSFASLAPLNDGLGFLTGSLCPHYLGEEHRRLNYLDWVSRGDLPAGWAVDDYCALRFEDGQCTEALAEEEGHYAYEVTTHHGVANERELLMRWL